MQEFVSRYIAHQPDASGQVVYSPEEHAVWALLYQRQRALIVGRASDEFLYGLECLAMSSERIPQLPEVSKHLRAATGWQVVAVNALISARAFFELLAEKKFPAATFIRALDELDYVQEPDIFHELFGHCPMLTIPVYADFLQQYAQMVLSMPEKDWPLLQRLFWFTVEFGLINTPQGLRAYGGGILSSISEAAYSVESDVPLRVLFAPVAALRTPYRIDELQRIYFVISAYEQLYALVHADLAGFLQRARELGEYPSVFRVDKNNPNIHILAC
jgi:phenylalanine-4-hydroxylase